MNFKEAEKIYADLKKKLSLKKITDKEFSMEVNKLRCKDEGGRWWQISGSDGSWLFWDGTGWKKGKKPEGKSPPPSERKSVNAPGTTLELFIFLLKGFFRGWFIKIPLLFIFPALTLIIHTYLMAVVNDGYNSDPTVSPFLSSTLALRDRPFSGIFFWTFISFIISGTFFQFFASGPAKIVRDLASFPSWLHKSLKGSGSLLGPVLFGSGALALLVGTLPGSRMFSFYLLFISLWALFSRENSLFFLFPRLLWSDIQKLSGGKTPEKKFNAGLAPAGTLGLALGFFAAFILPFAPYCGCAGSLLLFSLMIFLLVLAKNRGASGTVILLLFLDFFLCLKAAVYGDDLGYREFQGSFLDYIKSGQFMEIVKYGIPPAIGSVLGTALGPFVYIPDITNIIPASDGVEPADYTGQTESGEDETSGSVKILTDIIRLTPGLLGGISDNIYTEFHGGQGPAQCSSQGLPNYWVNTATLNLAVKDTVFFCNGPGPDVSFTLTYNLNPENTGMFGRGWTFSYESFIKEKGDQIYLYRPSGQRFTYKKGSSASYPNEALSPEGKFDRLLDYGKYWVFMEKETGLMYRYEKLSDKSDFYLSSIYDFNKNTVQINYNSDASIQSITDGAGRITLFEYDKDRLCKFFKIADGRTAQFDYNSKKNLVRTVDFLGIATDYEYDKDNYMTSMAVGRDKKTTGFTYKDKGFGKQISSVIDACGNTTLYEMWAPHEVKVTQPEGDSTTYYSTGGLTEKVVDSLGNYTLTKYVNGLPVSYQDKNGNVSEIEYDKRGNVKKFTGASGNSRFFSYDSYDNLISEIDASGGKKCYSYDDKYNLTGITSPGGSLKKFSCDSKGQIISITDSIGGETLFSHDKYGNVIEVTNPLGYKTLYGYEGEGFFRTSIQNGRGNITKFKYDSNGRLIEIVNPDKSNSKYIYDCCSQICSVDERGNKSAAERNSLMYAVKLIDPGSKYTVFDYDRNGRMVSKTYPVGEKVLISYDPAGRPVKIKDPDGNDIEISYDKNGNLILLKNQAGNIITFSYDSENRVVSQKDALNNKKVFTRNSKGYITSYINARGEMLKLSYDNEGRLTEKFYEDKKIGALKYDSEGNLTALNDLNGSSEYFYDICGRVVSVKYADKMKLDMDYDEEGNIKSITYPGNMTVKYDYDCRERPVRVRWGGNSIDYDYDPVGNLISEKRSNGTESFYSYDANNLINGVIHKSRGADFVNLEYLRDLSGNIVEECGVQPLSPSVSDRSLVFDYNECDQIIKMDNYTCLYDKDGNLTGVGNNSFKAFYDRENRPLSMTVKGETTFYSYNGLGHRVKSESNGRAIFYHYGPYGRLLFETDGDGNIISFYIYNGTSLAARCDGAGEVHYYHFDKTGSSLALTDNRGKIAVSYAYSPFGTVIKRKGKLYNPFTYGGKYGVMDEGRGFFFMKNRYYYSNMGKFLQKDPAGILGGINLYEYANSNPVNNIDPEGLVAVALALIVGGVALYKFASWMESGGSVSDKILPVKPLQKADEYIKTYVPQNKGVKILTPKSYKKIYQEQKRQELLNARKEFLREFPTALRDYLLLVIDVGNFGIADNYQDALFGVGKDIIEGFGRDYVDPCFLYK